MQGKKRYFVVVLFLLLGLTTFTFASPREANSQKPKNGTSEKVSQDSQARRSYTEAVEAVEDAEEDPTLETVENARLEIQNADDATDDQIAQLQNRVNVVENTIDIAALVSELEELVKAKETFDTASLKYPTADTEVNKLEEGNVKENLVTRLERVERILNDSSKPAYTGVTNNQITNENVKLVVTDDTEVTKTVTLNNEVMDFKEEFQEEGVYVVTLVDEAFNEEVVTFTIDKTAPKFVDLKSGNHYETITVLVDDETATITALNNDTKETTQVLNGAVLTEDATYKLTVKDAAGNSKSIWVAVDTTKPTITGVTNGSIVNKSEKIYVKDKFLTNVKITGPNSKGKVVTKEYTRSDFEVGANNENFSFEYKANYEGEWTVVATDKAGNTHSETFTIDRTAAKKNAVNANVNGYKNEVKEQYATNGKTVTAYISVNEQLKHNPTFTFYTNGKEVKVVGKEEVVASVRESGDYPYVYTAKLVINEELVAEDGEITFTVTDIYDVAGNQTTDITKMSVGNKVLTLDRTPNRITFTTISTDNENVDGKVYYITAGDTVTFRMGVREKFSENPVVTIAGKPVELSYVKYFEQSNHHEYRGTLKLDDTLVDGNLAITISNLTDEVGNKGFYYQTNGKKVLETITKTETTNGKSLVYDNTAPVNSYVAILSKGNNYLYAKNGDTIRFLVAFNEEVKLSDDFAITFNGKTKKLSRSGDKTKYEYIAEFKIPADEAELKEGLLTFEVKGFADKLGNLSSEVLTNATHTKYNKVTYDRTAPTFSTTAGYNENGTNPYIKVEDANAIAFKVYRKGTETPVHEFDSTTVGKSFKIGWHGGGVYTILATDFAGNESSKEFEVYHTVDSVEDLENAFKNGGTAIITSNINITELVEVPEGAELEIDLNGNDLNLINPEGETGKLISNKGKLTIKNGNITSANSKETNLIRNEEGAELTLDNINYSDSANTNSSSIINKGKLTITNSKINGKGSTNGNTLISNNGNMTIKNTEVIAKSVKGYVANIWSGNVLVEDSNLDTERGGLAILGGNVTINNTNIDAAVGGNNYRALYIVDGTADVDVNVTVNGGNFVGYRDCVYIGHGDIADIKVRINGGTYNLNKGTRNGNLYNVVPKNNAKKKFDVKISGGTLKYKPYGNVEDYLAEGYRINSEGRIVKENAISTKAEMVSAIAEGGKFELDTDLTLTDTSLKVAKNKDVEINLNGKTITARSTNSSASNAIEVSAGGNLKLTGNGKIEFTAGSPDTDWGEGSSKPYPGYASNTIVNRGTLVIDGPTIVNNTEYGGATYAVDAYAGSKLTLISGEISAPYNRAIRMFTSSETPSTDVTIKGGKVTGNIPLYVHVAGSNSSIAPTVNLNVSGGEIGTLGGWSLYTYSYGNSFKNINVAITGGDFYGTVAFSGGKKVDKENVSITGGKFHSELGRYLADDGWEDITKPE